MPLDSEFLAGVQELYAPSMGTETMAPLLYSLVRFVRPRTVVEVGAGYTSLFLLRALADNVEDDANERKRLRGAAAGDAGLLLPEYYEATYSPRLTSFDTLEHPHATAHRVEDVAHRLGLSAYLQFERSDFRGRAEQFDTRPIDLAWTDAGSWELFLSFFGEYWERLNPAGGVWLIHSTQTNLEGIAFVDKLKLLQATEAFRDLELVSFLEPHKLAQNSTTIVRRTTGCVDRILTPTP